MPPKECLNAVSRLKGIETVSGAKGSTSHLCLNAVSRLKGIETGRVMVLTPKIFKFECSFPFEGN